MKDAIYNYIKDYYYNNSNINQIFKDHLLKKLIKGHIVYNEMLNIIEMKNKEIDDLRRKLKKFKSSNIIDID